MQKGFVYILEDENGSYYVGSTVDVERRLRQHRGGHTQTTAKMRGLRLVLSQEYDSLEKARKVELKIKRLKRKDYLAKMVSEGLIRIK